MPSVQMVVDFAQRTQSKNGRPMIIQVFAGLFCLAITGSCRGSDAQRTQNMRRTKNALTGESRMKTTLVGSNGQPH